MVPSCRGSYGRLDEQHMQARQKEKGSSKTQPTAMRKAAKGSIAKILRTFRTEQYK